MAKDGVTVKLPGYKKCLKMLSKVKDVDKQAAVQRSFVTAGHIIEAGETKRLQKGMKNPQGVTGNLLHAIKVNEASKGCGVYIGFERPKGNHAHLVDKGHMVVSHRKRTGIRTKPIEFRMKTYNSEGRKARKLIRDNILRVIDNQLG